MCRLKQKLKEKTQKKKKKGNMIFTSFHTMFSFFLLIIYISFSHAFLGLRLGTKEEKLNAGINERGKEDKQLI